MALRWRKSYIRIANISLLPYDPLVARRIQACPDNLARLDPCQATPHASLQLPGHSDLLFAPCFALLSVLTSNVSQRLLAAVGQASPFFAATRAVSVNSRLGHNGIVCQAFSTIERDWPVGTG